MRGGAQAHLMEAEDGHFYVVKFANNPQHRRILVNEWLATAIFDHLRLQTPPVACVELTDEFLAANPEVYMQLGTRRLPPDAGWHYGSRYPGDPQRIAVYDFLPDALLRSLHNLRDFHGALAADKWLANSDSRQAIFHRAQVREISHSIEHPLKKVFIARMIDHGFALNGPYWDFPDAALHGVYFRHCVYEGVTSIDSFEPWLSQIEAFPIEALDAAVRAMPPSWLAGDDRDAVDQVCEKLIRRRGRTRRLLAELRESRVNPFRDWQ